MKVLGKGLKIQFAPSSKFSILPMNREIDSKHVQKMVTSIKKMGVIRPVIACRTNMFDGITKLYIIDGQHLATAMASVGEDVPYSVIDVADENDLVDKMAYLNNSSKSWDLMNYVHAFKMVNPEYMKLFKLKNMYDIEPLMIAAIALNSPTVNGYPVSKVIKSGEFVVKNPQTEAMCKAFNEFFLKIGRADRWVKINFLTVFIAAYKTYDHEKSLKNLEKHLSTIKIMSDSRLASEFIAKNIFNYTKGKK